MSEAELKPCPFCGRSGAILDEPLNEDEYGCFCNAHCGAIGPCDEDGEKAMEFWNTRPLEDAANARAEAAEARVHELQAALQGLMQFHPEDELGPQTEEYWTPEYKAAMDAARDALKGGEE